MQTATWKVGLLVVVFGALAYGVYVTLGAHFTQHNGYTLYADFASANGLIKGAKVMMAGVEIGTVDAVRLTNPSTARVTMTISNVFRIPRGATAQLPGSILLPADQRVDVIPPKVARGTLHPGEVLPGRASSSLTDIVPAGEKTLAELNKTLKSVRGLLEDKATRQQLKSILANADASSHEIVLLITQVNRLMIEEKPLLVRTLKDASAATGDVRKAVAEASKLLGDPQWKDRVEKLLDSVQSTAEKTNKLVESTIALVNDPKLRGNVDSSMANVEKITGTGVEISKTAKDIAANAKIFTDKANSLADDAADIADEAKRLLNRLNEIAASVPTIHGPRLAEPKVQVDFLRNFEIDRFRTDINVTYPLRPGAFAVGGVYDATEQNKVNLQYKLDAGHRLWTRYGLYASKPGVGVDFALSPRVGLEADLFNPNDATFNVRSRFRLGPNWGAFVGFDRLFHGNDFTVGLSLER